MRALFFKLTESNNIISSGVIYVKKLGVKTLLGESVI